MKTLAALLLLLAATSVWAEGRVISLQPDDIEVVIYRDEPTLTSSLYENANPATGLALITETRTVNLPLGVSTILFKRTAESIVPQTAKLLGIPSRLIEANFDYAAVSPAAIIQASIGKQIRLIRTDRSTGQVSEEKAILRSGPDGIIFDFGGHTEALGCSGLNEKIIFDEVPPSLVTEPSLSVKVKTSKAGNYQLQLSYLTTGLDWSVDYVARVKPDGISLDIIGWITLSNGLSTSFPNAVVKVVAGNLSVDNETTDTPKPEAQTVEKRCWPMTAAYFNSQKGVSAYEPTHIVTLSMRQAPVLALEEVIVTASKREATLSDLGDYKLYSIPEPTNLAANQTKQVLFLEKKNVHYERIYSYQLDPEQSAGEDEIHRGTVTLRLENKVINGLGVPLPMGTVATFDVNSADEAVFSGDHWIRDVAINSPTEIDIGEAIDVWSTSTIIGKKNVSRWWRSYRETEFEIRVGNNKAMPVRMEIRLDQEQYSELSIASESKSHTSRSGKLIWAFNLMPSEQDVLHLNLRQSL